jgi:hypothetical protein
MYHNPREVQQATLLSIKTGGCVVYVYMYTYTYEYVCIYIHYI